MSLLDKITTDMKEAMKAKEAEALSTLRMLKSAVKNAQIDHKGDWTDDETMKVISSQLKQLKDSMESFVEAKREEMVTKIKAEIDLLESYLPEQMSDEDLETAVKEAISEIGATTKEEMGKVMGAAMGKVKGLADGTRVKAMVDKLLS